MTTSSNQATAFFMHQETQKYEGRMSTLLSQANRATDIRALARLHLDAQVAAHAIIRPLIRSSPSKSRFEGECLKTGEAIIDMAIKNLSEHRRCPDEQYKNVKGRFIRDVLEPCRGHFPALYHKADRLCLKIEGWRHLNLKSESDAVFRPKKGDDLQALGYVFHNTSIATLSHVLKEGLTAGSFTREPIDFGKNTWIAVQESRLPAFQEHDYAGVQALEPNWESEKIHSYDDNMNSVITKGPVKSIDFDLVIVCDKKGFVKNDGLLSTALGSYSPAGLRFRS